MDISESLKKLNSILAGKSMKELLSNVDKSVLPQTSGNLDSSNPTITSGFNNEQQPVNINSTDDLLGTSTILFFPEPKATVEENDKPAKDKKKKKKKDKEKKKDKDKEKDSHSHSKKKKHTMRYAAGEMYEDHNLEDWPEDDYRIYCFNLGNEVTDEMLALAFRKYQSFNRCRVIRDKLTSKTRGFGFVSLQRLEDYVKAMKEMEGVYVGNRPLKLARSKWKDRSADSNKDKLKDALYKKHKKMAK